jgi:hypothetical protein
MLIDMRSLFSDSGNVNALLCVTVVPWDHEIYIRSSVFWLACPQPRNPLSKSHS